MYDAPSRYRSSRALTTAELDAPLMVSLWSTDSRPPHSRAHDSPSSLSCQQTWLINAPGQDWAFAVAMSSSVRSAAENLSYQLAIVEVGGRTFQKFGEFIVNS